MPPLTSESGTLISVGLGLYGVQTSENPMYANFGELLFHALR
jgi:hypothetical protein